jgi:hypothetical protein
VYRAAANGKNVAIAGGGTLLWQVIKLGLLAELELHIVPVILGDGMRLLGPGLGLDSMEGIELPPARVIAGPDVTHVRYSIAGRRRLSSTTEDETRNPPPPAQIVRVSEAPKAAAPYDHLQRSGRNT